jgi:hypothetical protein
MTELKEKLYILCLDYINTREVEIRKAIDEAQEAANNETKSSAGDKFETGREAMQQEIDLNLVRQNELRKIKTVLDFIIPAQISSIAVPGSLIYTNNGNFYIAISAGQLKIDDKTYYAVSAASPIGTQLMGKTAGHQFTLNGKQFKVEKVV